ncbi:hypothetical protein ISN44_As13g013720, partial [Arabidopsis suecica]
SHHRDLTISSTSQQLLQEIMARKRSCNINIPLDLMVEILKKLPAKSLARFQCVSKQWTSIIVINSIVTRSLTQPPSCDPHFIFSHSNSQFSFVFSHVHEPHQITNQEQQLYHEEICGKGYGIETRFQYLRGLVGFWRSSYCYLCLAIQIDPSKNLSCRVFTLGDPKKKWMRIQCGIGSHFPLDNAVCINGAIYYKATKMKPNESSVLVSFDVRSEKFNHVRTPNDMAIYRRDSTLINYQGKLAFICRNNMINEDADMWVMEDAEKQEWSKITFFGMLQGITSGIRIGDVTHP